MSTILLRLAAGLFVVSGGYIWTVGQAGLNNTNQNLCELVSSLSPWAFEGCKVQLWIVLSWAVLCVAAGAYLALVAIRICIRWMVRSHHPNRRPVSPSAPSKWIPLGDAIEAYGDPTMLEAFLEATAKAQQVRAEYEEAFRRGSPYQAIYNEWVHASGEAGAAHRAILEDFASRLEAGTLVAEGFENDTDKTPVRIDKIEWRKRTRGDKPMNPSQNQISLGGITYTGVVIGQPR